jgi:hypothetical protein
MRNGKDMHRIWVVSNPVLWAQVQYLITVLETIQGIKDSEMNEQAFPDLS